MRRRAMARALLEPDDPRENPPNENLAGPNIPPISVGPTSSTNAPGNFVAQPWSGWPEGWATPEMEELGGGAGGSSLFGFGRLNPGGYLRRVSTVMTCADLNSRQLASFPAYGLKGRQPVDLPSWYTNGPEPTLYPDWSSFAKALGNSYWLSGEAIVWCIDRYRSNGYPARFVALNPSRVTNDDDGEWYLNGETHLPRADVCHIPYQTIPGYRRGVGPLIWATSAMVDAATLDAYASRIAQLGVWGVLKVPGDLTGDAADALKWKWAEARASSIGIPAVVSGGVEYETVTMSPKDLALLDLKWFDHQMIAAAMGVPAVLANLPQSTGLTYSSTLMLMDFHWRATLRPAAQSWSGALSRWALPVGTTLEFNPDRYVQPDLEARARAYQTLFAIQDPATGERAISVDEIRLAERFPVGARPGPVADMATPIGPPSGGPE